MNKQLIFITIFFGILLSANEDAFIKNYNENLNIAEPEILKNNYFFENKEYLDISKYKKVSLMDVVLETISNSDLLKASREKVIQSELKLKDAIAGYYPTLNLESETGRTKSTSYGSSEKYKYYDDRNLKFILSQNIYSGLETTNTIKSLEKKLSVEKNQYEILLQEQITKAIKAYFDVVFSHKSVLASERNMIKLNKILEIITIKYDNGAATIGDLTAIKANVSNSETQLTKVKSKLTESMKYYEYIVGEKYYQTLPYEKNFNINISSFDLLYERALTRNSTILNYYNLIESEKFNLKSKESSFSPKLDFEVSLDNILDQEDYKGREQDLNAKLKFTMNLYNGGKDQNKILTSYSSIRALNFELNEEKKKLKWNIAKLFTSIQSTNESLKSNISEIVSLRKMVDAYWEEFNLGQQDLQSLLQGYKQLNSAEIELIKNESSNTIDLFSLLGYTGDLLSFFDLEPVHPKYIDFSKSNYSQNVYIDDKFLNEKERNEKEYERRKEEEFKRLLANQTLKDINIDNFIKNFMLANDEFFTIEIGKFKNNKEATDFIKNNNLDMNSFSFDIIENSIVTSKISHGIFSNMELAKASKDKLSEKYKNSQIIIKKIKDVKKHYSEYISGLKINLPKPEVKIIEKINTIEKIKQRKEDIFLFEQEIMNKFLNASDDLYTIHITSFNENKYLENILSNNRNLYSNSYVYTYSNGRTLIRWNYGIYETYDEAQKAIKDLGEVANSYYPVVQKVSKEKELYNSYVKPKEDDKKEVEFEYIDVSSKTEYKELNNSSQEETSNAGVKP
ncbi:TolC family protein [Aliarcobacter cryaerophilus]|uniref:TolC family protein n=1 Tax=Aliarcobacter cryaerophilus TaxID=28198 RepID=UPI0021B5E877|nr:TolC family protein [Aliarcobacter cryaerophilus]MCT7485311.1 TolC family protein [Aliarcobacter cryaerophilus]MCT7489519.1 TolC family protein [Aliarcobacter cryaerophilus]